MIVKTTEGDLELKSIDKLYLDSYIVNVKYGRYMQSYGIYAKSEEDAKDVLREHYPSIPKCMMIVRKFLKSKK